MKRRTILCSTMAAIVGSMPFRSRAAAGKPIRLVVPFTPGGTTDILARALLPYLAQGTGQAVIIDNRPGAGGGIAGDFVAHAEPDGDTLFMGHIGTLAVNPSIYPKLPYDPVKSFVPIAWLARVPNVLVVNAASGPKTFEELLERAKAAPNKLTYSSGGNGSAAHIAFELLKLRAHIAMTHVPYRGTAPSVTDLLAGQVDATFTGTPAVLPHIQSGRLRALAVSSKERLPQLPQVPTVAERGIPGFEADQWYGVVAPAATPREIVLRLNGIVNKASALPEVQERFGSEGAIPVQATPEAFGALIAAEIPRWREVVKAGNVKAD